MPAEFTSTFYETQQLYDLVRSYGIDEMVRTGKVALHRKSAERPVPVE